MPASIRYFTLHPAAPQGIVFLDAPRVPLSNAHVERQQRRTTPPFEYMRDVFSKIAAGWPPTV